MAGGARQPQAPAKGHGEGNHPLGGVGAVHPWAYSREARSGQSSRPTSRLWWSPSTPSRSRGTCLIYPVEYWVAEDPNRLGSEGRPNRVIVTRYSEGGDGGGGVSRPAHQHDAAVHLHIRNGTDRNLGRGAPRRGAGDISQSAAYGVLWLAPERRCPLHAPQESPVGAPARVQ